MRDITVDRCPHMIDLEPGAIVELSDYTHVNEWQYVGIVKTSIRVVTSQGKKSVWGDLPKESPDIPRIVLKRITEVHENVPGRAEYVLARPKLVEHSLGVINAPHNIRLILTWGDRIYADDLEGLRAFLKRWHYSLHLFEEENNG